ncbi:MAG: hypothetical protein ACOCVF_02765 [bacterium]
MKEDKEEYTPEEQEFIDLVKEVGMETAISMQWREDNKDWKCPACKSKMIMAGQCEYETLGDHVFDPNKESYPPRDYYICSDEKCFTREYNIFWDYMGDRYGSIPYEIIRKWGIKDCDELFIDSNDSPFGSNGRKSNVEIYKKGLKKQIWLHRIFGGWFFQPFIEFYYKANTQGEVLTRSWKLKFVKRYGRCNGCLVNYWWDTWKYLYRKYYKLL